MKHYLYQNNQWVAGEDIVSPAEGSLQWFDFSCEETGWADTIYELTGIAIHENHIKDSLNLQHPPKCETSSSYEFLIMPVIEDTNIPLNLHSCSFFFTDSLLISVRPSKSALDSAIFRQLKKSKLTSRGKRVCSIPGLLHLLLNDTTNSQMEVRGTFRLIMEDWQEKLMSRTVKKGGWEDYYHLQRELNLLINSAEQQAEVLSVWEKETELEITEHQHIRFRDLSEHLDRIGRHLKDLREDSDNLLQIYFSITQEKTNRVVQLLTVISVIFLPLHLIAGLFGMNIADMPMQNMENGFWYISVAMVFIVMLLAFLLFRFGSK